jgi:hypothetical protein
MSEGVPPEEQGGDPPCWAAQFDDSDEGDPDPEADQDDGRSSRV